MAQKVTLHLLCFNEADILPFSLRHYATFCSRMVVHDLGSNDGSQSIALAAGAEVNQHDCHGEFDDRLNKRIKEEEWKGDDCDFAIMADADELIYFPGGAFQAFSAYETQGLAVIKPRGYEMFSDVFPETEGQIYDEIKMGAPDFFWYSKPIMFSPKRVASIIFGMGSHWCEATLHDGRKVKLLQEPPLFSTPEACLLHCHHIGGVERIARRYDENFKRQSEINHRMKWGNQKPGIEHAMEKRAAILSGVRKVIA